MKKGSLEIETLVVVLDRSAEERWITSARGVLAGSAEDQGVHVAGGCFVPCSMAGDVGVAGLQESLVARLDLRDGGALGWSRRRDSAELPQSACEAGRDLIVLTTMPRSSW